MIVEYVRYDLPAETVDPFHEAYKIAGSFLSADRHCLGWDLRQSVEEPARHVVRIKWDSVEGHEQGFRGTAAYKSFLGTLHPFRTCVLEMGHYEQRGSDGREHE